MTAKSVVRCLFVIVPLSGLFWSLLSLHILEMNRKYTTSHVLHEWCQKNQGLGVFWGFSIGFLMLYAFEESHSKNAWWIFVIFSVGYLLGHVHFDKL